MSTCYRELYVNRQEDEVVFTEAEDEIVIGFRKMLLTLDRNDFMLLLLRFKRITTHPGVWENKGVRSVMVEMPGHRLQLLFTRSEAEAFYSVVLHAWVML